MTTCPSRRFAWVPLRSSTNPPPMSKVPVTAPPGPAASVMTPSPKSKPSALVAVGNHEHIGHHAAVCVIEDVAMHHELANVPVVGRTNVHLVVVLYEDGVSKGVPHVAVLIF